MVFLSLIVELSDTRESDRAIQSAMVGLGSSSTELQGFSGWPASSANICLPLASNVSTNSFFLFFGEWPKFKQWFVQLLGDHLRDRIDLFFEFMDFGDDKVHNAIQLVFCIHRSPRNDFGASPM